MAVNRIRGVDAQTVSDEHGKGAEILRQQVSGHYDVSSAAGAVTSAHHIMYCETDIIIRYIRIMSVDLPDADADLTTYRNRAGSILALHTAAAVDTFTTEIIQEMTISVARDFLKQDDTVYALMLRATASTESADWAVYFGWMPSILDSDAVIRTY